MHRPFWERTFIIRQIRYTRPQPFIRSPQRSVENKAIIFNVTWNNMEVPLMTNATLQQVLHSPNKCSTIAPLKMLLSLLHRCCNSQITFKGNDFLKLCLLSSFKVICLSFILKKKRSTLYLPELRQLFV